MSAALAGASFDWPLSRDEKKHHVMQLYGKELEAAGSLLQSTEAALEEFRACHRDEARKSHSGYSGDCPGFRHGRMSDASTADSEYSACGHPVQHGDLLCDDHLGSINEEVDGHAHNVTERLRQAVAEAAATLQVLTSRPSSVRRPSNAPSGPASASSSRHPSNSAGLTRCGSGRLPSTGSRVSEGPRRTSRGGRSRQASVASDNLDSDGGQGDTEELSVSRRRRSGAGPVTRQKASHRVKSCNMDKVVECDSPKHTDLNRSRSVPVLGENSPAVRKMPMLSLDAFLGESVPFCPFT